jgi:RHS repeat-associated protein
MSKSARRPQVTFAHDRDQNPTAQANAVSPTVPGGTSSTSASYDAADNNTQSTSTLAQTCGGNETLTQSFSGTGGSLNPDNQVTADSEAYAGSCSGQGSYHRYYSYDPVGRVTYQGSTAQGASPNGFAYDPAGDPTTISSHDASSNFDTFTQGFDSAGQLSSQTPVAGSNGSSSTYTYNTLGAQTGVTTGASSATYGFDQTGHMTSATTPAGTSTYLYTGDGLEAGTHHPGPLVWGSPTDSDGTKTLNAVSCATATMCKAVDNSGGALTFNGTNWSTAASIDSTRSIASVSCPTSTFCAAVDASGYATTYNGTSWSTPANVDSGKAFSSVSCVSSSFCAATDTSGGALTYNGTSWSSRTTIDSSKVLEAVSCASATVCKATDNAGNVLTYNGSSWSAASKIDATRTVKAISCPTASFCAAVDASGYGLTYNGTSWSTATDIDGAHAIDAVSCTSASSCTAVDNAGDALTFNGTTWSAAQNIDSSRVLDGVSCPTTTLCAAMGASGYSVIEGSTSTTSQLTWNSTASLPLVISDGSYDYVYGPAGTPVEQVSLTSSTPTYMTYTPSDSSWLVTNAAGDETGFWRYDAFGTLAYGTPASAFGFAGQYADASTRLFNDRARFYEPQIGGFTTRDPAFSQTDQAYAYAGDDPVNRTDPAGLIAIGQCGMANGQAGYVGLSGDGCLVRLLGTTQMGVTGSIGVTGGLGENGSAGLYYQVSNAANLSDLSKWFGYATVGGEYGAGLSVTLFWSLNASSDFAHATYGIEFGPSLGHGIDAGIGVSYTRVAQLTGLANTLALLWFDATNPTIGATDALAYALTQIYALIGKQC